MSAARGDRITRINDSKFENGLDVRAIIAGRYIEAKLIFALHIEKPKFWVSLYSPRTKRYLPVTAPFHSKKQDALDWFISQGGKIIDTAKSRKFLHNHKVMMPNQLSLF